VRANSLLFWILAGFFWLADFVYIIWSINDPVRILGPARASVYWWQNIEWVGTLAVFLSGMLAALIAFYIGRVHRGLGGELPEDRPDALIDDGDAEQGFYSPWSWWPIMIGASLALVFLGVAIGIWISFIGGSVLIISLIGWQFEYYRGYFAH
jgi:Cytochrome c oxidase subunit IV